MGPIEQKFYLGQLVERVFEKEVEGVKVTVKKRLFVWGVKIHEGSSNNNYLPVTYYELGENYPTQYNAMGRKYTFPGHYLTAVDEPIVEAIAASLSQPVDVPAVCDSSDCEPPF